MLSEVLGTAQVFDLDAARASGALEPNCSASAPATTVRESDDVVLVFSSGTTDRPKAVRHTHRSICRGTEHWVAALGLGHDDRFQVATPPSHILGLLNLLAAAAAGATVRLHRRFDLDEVLRRIESERMTLEMAVAPIALAMANHPELERYDLSSLRYIMWGATPVTPSVAETVTARTGVRWLPAYGASEVPVIAANPVGDPGAWRLDSAGLPPADVTLRAVDLDTGAVLAAGQVGEIQVQSPSAMAGYLPEEATAGAFDDGWYRTGDVGWLEPEGWVHLTDRCKEMIKVSGFQVAPAEIEGVLLGHPAVVDCAVFGVADERAGEVPVAAVQLEPGSAVTAGELRDAGRPGARHLQAPAPRRDRRGHPADTVGQGAAPHPPRRVGADRGPRRPRRRMDVRLSPEQRALRDSAVQVVERLGVRAVAQLDDRERAGKLDAAVDASGWRELRTPARGRPSVGVAGRGRDRGRGARPGSGRRRLPRARPWRRSSAGSPARRRPTAARRSRSATDLAEPACAVDGLVAAGAVAIDAAAATSALVLVAGPGGYAVGAVPIAGVATGADLTRPVARRARRRHRSWDRADLLDDSATSSPGGASAWPSRAPTSSAPCGARSTLACDYARARRQYGAAIGSFQAVQHLLADAFVAMEGSRSIALHAAWAVDALPSRRRAGRGVGGQGLLRPRGPRRCARRPFRCTAASATPGTASPTSSCGGRSSRATCSAASGPTWTGCSRPAASEGDDGLR